MARLKNTRYFVWRDTAGMTALPEDTDFTTATARNKELFENRVAFVSLRWHPNGKLYCGCTAANSDIFAEFDPVAERFRSLGYHKIAEPFEVKIHRSLELASDGTIYGATACLYSMDQRLKAPGGSIFRYHPSTDRIEKLGIPVPRDYAQTITLDEKRGLIHGMTQPVFKYFVYHLATGKTEDFDAMESITHISALDDDGCYWGTWDSRRHYLFKYNPDTHAFTFYRHSVPEGAKFADIMYRGAGPVDCMINGGDGYMYIGTTGGTLCRLEPRTGAVIYLGRPYPTKRLPGLALIDERRILCAGGDEDGGFLAVYDRKTNGFELLGPIKDSASAITLFRVHDLVLTPDHRTAYVAETDVARRSGYLWACAVEL
jgi:hypothetical protein